MEQDSVAFVSVSRSLQIYAIITSPRCVHELLAEQRQGPVACTVIITKGLIVSTCNLLRISQLKITLTVSCALTKRRKFHSENLGMLVRGSSKNWTIKNTHAWGFMYTMKSFWELWCNKTVHTTCNGKENVRARLDFSSLWLPPSMFTAQR